MNNPYETPGASLQNAGATNHIYAGFWIRVLASLVDTLLLMIVIAPIALTFFGTGFFTGTAELGLVGNLINYILPAVVIILFWIYKSATPGKMICGIEIIDEKTGGKLSPGQSILRYVGYYVSSIVLLLGFLWVIWDGKKQGWHDKMAGTLVVKKAP